MSLFRTKGGKTSAVRMPSEAEGFALAVASAMQWAHLADGVKAFLEKQAPKVVLFPAAKLCLEKALKFLPVLERGLAKHAAAAAGRSDQGPELDFGDD